MAERPGVLFYFDLEPALAMLSDAEAGQLFKAAMAYGHFGVVPEFGGMAAMAWTFVKPKIDRDNDAYQKTCVQNAYNRYVGECKKNGTTALSREAWEVKIYVPRQRELTSVDGGLNPSPTTTGTGTTTGAITSTPTSATDGEGEGAGRGKGKGARGEGKGETDADKDNSQRDAALEMLDNYVRLSRESS